MRARPSERQLRHMRIRDAWRIGYRLVNATRPTPNGFWQVRTTRTKQNSVRPVLTWAWQPATTTGA